MYRYNRLEIPKTMPAIIQTPDIWSVLTSLLKMSDPMMPPNCSVRDENDRSDDLLSSGRMELIIVLSGIFIIPLIMNKKR